MTHEGYREVLAVDPAEVPLGARLWRPPWRIAVAAWAGVLVGALAAFVAGVPRPGAVAVAAAVGLGSYLLPLPASRRAPIEVEVAGGELRIRQGDREERIALHEVRSVRVAAEAGRSRHGHGWGRTWGHAGRPVWDLPARGLGLVVIDRGAARPDLGVASAAPHELARAILARQGLQSTP